MNTKHVGPEWSEPMNNEQESIKIRNGYPDSLVKKHMEPSSETVKIMNVPKNKSMIMG